MQCAGAKEQFPIFEDRIATQHLVYLRLARLQNPAQLAKASEGTGLRLSSLLVGIPNDGESSMNGGGDHNAVYLWLSFASLQYAVDQL